ncbi:hypothetical protein LOZ51_000432 [Ophidiomyces ophidiicola]|nr:hypothetical protein LOZ55_003613 [Ophidiomyces ophidiicola]KAI1991461.1 hypothetical protein LOZ54_002085 [Ophidiomyces ophidiicola]KAI2003354.1 hypothetical protein LOZ51_000432 [Ophidiomyces ophidiicola]
MDSAQAVAELEALLGRTLVVHTTDTRLFAGSFKCTDADRNIILANTYEYRYPTAAALSEAAARQSPDREGMTTSGSGSSVTANMTSRFIGLVVVPGRHITKIEVDNHRPGRSGR